MSPYMHLHRVSFNTQLFNRKIPMVIDVMATSCQAAKCIAKGMWSADPALNECRMFNVKASRIKCDTPVTYFTETQRMKG